MEDERENNRSKNKAGCNKSSYPENCSKEMGKNTSAGPTVLLLWMWNWFSTIPKAVTHFYADLKSGEFLARFTLLDAMMQFIVAIATSCHPQEENMYEKYESDEHKTNISEAPSGRKVCDGVDVFSGKGRTLRSRMVETN